MPAQHKIWLDAYEPGVPENLDALAFDSVADYILDCCGRYSQSAALSSFGVQLQYRRYAELGEAFAAYLQQDLGLAAGERVAVMMPNLLQYPVVILGALRAGLVVVNFNPFYSERELREQLIDSGASTVVIFNGCAARLQAVLEQTPVRHVIVTAIGDLFPWPRSILMNGLVRFIRRGVPPWRIAAAIPFRQTLKPGRRFEPVPVRGDDLAFLQYTGGTTGRAKGAMLSHSNLLANIEQTRVWLRATLEGRPQRVIVALPLYHVFALTQNFLSQLQFGGIHYLVTDPRDARALVRLIGRSRCTVLAGVNALFLKILQCSDTRQVDFSDLQFVVGGGAAIQSTVAERWQETTGVSICQAYGLTEASPGVTCNPLPVRRFDGSVGVPVSSTLIRIVDEDGAPVTAGEAGELQIKGPQVMQGYWNNPAETRRVLDSEGWLRSGDISVMDAEGFIRIVDRSKDMIIVSGFKVYPNEVEEVISAHPDVVDVGVIGEPDTASGERISAFVVCANASSLDAGGIRAYCRERLTGYKVPTRVEFVEDIPKSRIGKVLRRALREIAAGKTPLET